MGPTNKPIVPLLDLTVLYARHRREIDDALSRVVESQRFIMGPEVAAFESEMADYLGDGAICLGTSNGTDALILCAMALGIQPGDEVIIPAYTFVASASAFAFLGARPVFADVEPDSLAIAPERVAERLTDRTKAVVPVHLFGRAADMHELTRVLTDAGRPDVAVIEDTAQALGGTYRGRRLGTLGTLATLSFFPSKNLGGFGDGGMVVTRDRALAEDIQTLRNQGRAEAYRHVIVGLNARLDAIQAAVLRARLSHLDEWVAERRALADRYRAHFEQLGLLEHIQPPPGDADEASRHSYHQFSIRVRHGRRAELQRHLTEAGIGTAVYYPIPLPFQPCFAHLGHREGEFPVAETAARQSLALPVYPGLTEAAQDLVIDAIAAFFETP